MKKKRYIIIGVIAGVTIAGLGSFYISNKRDNQATDVKGSQTEVNTITDPITGTSLEYSTTLKQQELTEEDISDKFIFRLASTNPAILVSVRYEDGLSAVSALANQDLEDVLFVNTLKALPQRFPDFKLQSQQKLKIADREALDIVFTYTGPNGAQATQRFAVIVKDPNTAVYVSAQTSSTEFETLDAEYISPLINSLNFKN